MNKGLRLASKAKDGVSFRMRIANTGETLREILNGHDSKRVLVPGCPFKISRSVWPIVATFMQNLDLSIPTLASLSPFLTWNDASFDAQSLGYSQNAPFQPPSLIH